MQSDEEIGRMVASVPVAIGSAMEMFAERMLQSAAEALQNSSQKTLSPFHM
jgi:carbon monoxide dehydrogenase subunit G